MSSKFNALTFSLVALFLPGIALAAELEKTTEIFTSIMEIIKILIPIAFALAVLFFFFGMAKYIWSAGGAKDEGKKIMIWGIVALFVMTMIWGIIAFIGGSLGIDADADAPNIPTINT